MDDPLPFLDGLFEAIYSESAIALMDLPSLLAECKRVLSKKGRIFFNERVWKNGVTEDEADEGNRLSIELFGIRTSMPFPWDVSDWLDRFSQAGFHNSQAIPTENLNLPRLAKSELLRERISHAGSHMAHPMTYFKNLQFRFRARIYNQRWMLLESYIFLVR